MKGPVTEHEDNIDCVSFSQTVSIWSVKNCFRAYFNTLEFCDDGDEHGDKSIEGDNCGKGGRELMKCSQRNQRVFNTAVAARTEQQAHLPALGYNFLIRFEPALQLLVSDLTSKCSFIHFSLQSTLHHTLRHLQATNHVPCEGLPLQKQRARFASSVNSLEHENTAAGRHCTYKQLLRTSNMRSTSGKRTENSTHKQQKATTNTESNKQQPKRLTVI